jgi:hypothetical protein
MITGSMLYDLISCRHRVTMDLFADPAERDDVSPFIRMLWEKGSAHEQSIVGKIGVPVLDLSGFHLNEKERLTAEATERQEPATQQSANVSSTIMKMLVERHGYCWSRSGGSQHDDQQ